MAAKFEVYEQPSSRSSVTWTPALVRGALTTADGGSLRSLAELCESIVGDDRAQAVFDTRIGGLLALTPAFEASGDGRRRNRAVRALEVDEDWWTIAPEDQLFQIMVWGRLMGLGPYQHVWINRRGRMVPSLQFWHPRNLRWDKQSRRWFTRISRNGDNTQEVEFTPGDGQWGLYAPYGPFRPWAQGLWRGLSVFWLLKQYAISDWGRLGESASRVVGTSPEDTPREQRRELAQDIQALGRDGVVVLPGGCDLKLIEASAASRELFEKQIEVADRAITINVLGQNLTTDVKEGSFAAATVHGRVELQRVKADAQAASTALHDQTLAWWAEFNFGDRELAPWPVWPTDRPDDNEKTVKTWVQFGTALEAFQKAGLRIDAMAMAEKVGVPLLKEAEPSDTDPALKTPRTDNTPPDPNAPNADPTPPQDGGASDAPARNERPLRLASGDDPRLAAGFVEGQSYADAIVDRGQERGVEQLAAFLAELETLIEGVDSLETARARVVEFYREAPPAEDLAAMAERLFLMAQRGGAGAVQQDAPEVDFRDA